MPKKVRIGFIGAGGIAVWHFNRQSLHKQAELVALTEPNKNALKNFTEKCPGTDTLPAYSDYLEMIQNETLDGVVIMSPHTLHYDQITTCLNKGLNVLAEKPMVCTIKHAKAVIKKAEEKGLVLMLAYQRHFEPTFRYMRDQIQKGAIGEVQFVQAIQSQEWLRATKGTWRQDPELSGGGQLNDSGSHLVDIIMWVTGMKVKEVFAKSENFEAKVDINSTLAMTFENGALGSMSIIGNAPCWYEDHSIVGSKGAFYLRQGIGLIHQDATGKEVKVKLPNYKKDPNTNFIDCILGKAAPETPAVCGLRTIEVTEAAWKSAASGKPVRVP